MSNEIQQAIILIPVLICIYGVYLLIKDKQDK